MWLKEERPFIWRTASAIVPLVFLLWAGYQVYDASESIVTVEPSFKTFRIDKAFVKFPLLPQFDPPWWIARLDITRIVEPVGAVPLWQQCGNSLIASVIGPCSTSSASWPKYCAALSPTTLEQIAPIYAACYIGLSHECQTHHLAVPLSKTNQFIFPLMGCSPVRQNNISYGYITRISRQSSLGFSCLQKRHIRRNFIQ